MTDAHPTDLCDSNDFTEQKEVVDSKHISEKSTRNFDNYLETSAIQKGETDEHAPMRIRNDLLIVDNQMLME